MGQGQGEVREVEEFAAHLCELIAADRGSAAVRQLTDWLGRTGPRGALLMASHTATAVGTEMAARSVPMAELGGVLPVADAPLLQLLDGAEAAEAVVESVLRRADARPTPDDLAPFHDGERARFGLLYLLQCLTGARPEAR
ncbi:hypothetical protein P3T36_002765 [Kitasatospora sp. MAP12-15]|uniref:hypothetical protein n=1 Tax=unclassified Kitasatospora TaxID=2633591 RepID=UPI0024740A13|nr:hypothetical protein [Kitasatospora sp. MAP12-44]MDH6113944.1 hypothetical protein [Kitasatospora sp. MAP12-44]